MNELLDRMLRATPGGSQTLSKGHWNFPSESWPGLAAGGHGPYLYTEDGKKWIDYVLGLGAIGLGYTNDSVDIAVEKQFARGVSFSLPTRLEAEVAEQLIDIIPCAEMVRFVKTGSEACSAAVRIARAATGRDVILSCGYHGWHDWAVSTNEWCPGVARSSTYTIKKVPYNDLTPYEEYFSAGWSDEIPAAVILEPTLIDPPTPGFLEGVRELCTKHGAVLIFDEMLTGFRWHLGGAQSYFNVTPDLATFGKAMANGHPLACVTGRRGLMEQWGRLISGTFGGETLSLAAAQATIDVYRKEPVIEHMWEMGLQLTDGFWKLCCALSAPYAVIGCPVHPKIIPAVPEDLLGMSDTDNHDILALFLQESMDRGILIHPAGFNISYAHGPIEISETLLAWEEALKAIVSGKAKLRGEAHQEAFRRS